jgi:hypothetical protein
MFRKYSSPYKPKASQSEDNEFSSSDEHSSIVDIKLHLVKTWINNVEVEKQKASEEYHSNTET